jgi:hypothetical protein
MEDRGFDTFDRWRKHQRRPAMHRKHLVIIDWMDGKVEDSDEITVFADSPAEAIRKAREKWRLTIGASWPSCRITDSKILNKGACHPVA